MKQSLIMFMISLSLLSACTPKPPTDTHSLNGLQNLSASSTDSSAELATEKRGIRERAIEETAMSLGARGGLAFASEEINSRLQKDRWYLDTIYNFNGMMLSHGVLPPVLAEGSNTLNQSNSSTLRISDKTYSILQQARFATTPPNWRDYLWMNYPKPELPNNVLLPKNAEERKLWRAQVNRGWQKGIEQSYTLFRQNMARLKRDYNGMILYRTLLQKKMVSAPFVSRTDLGVTGDGNDMHINDQVLRITVLPKLQTNSQHWKAIMIRNGD